MGNPVETKSLGFLIDRPVSDEGCQKIIDLLSGVHTGQYESGNKLALRKVLSAFFLSWDNRLDNERRLILNLAGNGFPLPSFRYQVFDKDGYEISRLPLTPSLVSDKDIHPHTVLRSYDFRNEIELLVIYASEMTKWRMVPKKCENCGRWFVPTNRSDEKYCKRPSPQYPEKNCREAARLLKERTRIYSDGVKTSEKRAYCRLYQQSLRGENLLCDFAEERDVMKEKFVQGLISAEDYTSWLHGYKRKRG